MRHQRREFSPAVKAEAYARSGGLCECHRIPALKRPQGCGVALTAANGIFYEHVHCDALGGSPTVDNAAVLVKTCWREKTVRHDLPTIAKANRVRRRDRNQRRTPRQVMIGSRASGWKRTFNFGWERRT